MVFVHLFILVALGVSARVPVWLRARRLRDLRELRLRRSLGRSSVGVRAT